MVVFYRIRSFVSEGRCPVRAFYGADVRSEQVKGMKFEELKAMAEQQLQDTLESLPDELLPAAGIPVLLEGEPSPADQAEGIDSEILGLFVGPSLADPEGVDGEAPHIVLYLENLWLMAEGDCEAFREEVEITYLHELGHYLNLNEQDLEDRGLG